MTLSKAQQRVIDEARADIAKARSMDYPTWLLNHNSFYKSHRDRWEKAIEREESKDLWERNRMGEVLTHCNTKTLKILEEKGLIEILYESTGERWGVDEIKIIED